MRALIPLLLLVTPAAAEEARSITLGVEAIACPQLQDLRTISGIKDGLRMENGSEPVQNFLREHHCRLLPAGSSWQQTGEEAYSVALSGPAEAKLFVRKSDLKN